MKKHLAFSFLGFTSLFCTDSAVKADTSENRVGKVEYVGNTHFSTSLLSKYMQLQPGDTLNLPQVMTNIARMNQNLFHQTEVVFSEGASAGTTDIQLITQDRAPFRLFGGVDDTGDRSTGNMRLLGGFNWANLFNADQVFTYQYTASDEEKRFFSHTANYVIPLANSHFLAVYGGFLHARPDIAVYDPTIHRSQASSRYNLPIGKFYLSLLQDLSLGFDVKSTTRSVTLKGHESVVQKAVANMTQFVLGYRLGMQLASHKITVQPELFCSPVAWLPHQSKKDFQAVREFASPKYIFGRLSVEDRFSFSAWELGIQGRLQITNRALLPSEQFTLGGYNTVRGYSEQLVDMDNAVCLNAELKTPPLSPLKWVGKKIPDSLLFLVFADYGMGRDHQAAGVKKESAQILGVGTGVRYNVMPFLTSRLDWAFPLIAFQDHKLHQRVHFSVLLSY